MWLVLAILSVPLIEIALFVVIGGVIGLWLTLAWVIVSAALGLIVLKGVSGMGRVSISRDMRELREPLSPIAHRVMVAMGGVLLLLPGFFTDAIGLLILIPPVRLAIIRMIGRRISHRHRTAASSVTIEGEWQSVDPEDRPGQGKPPAGPTQH